MEITEEEADLIRQAVRLLLERAGEMQMRAVMQNQPEEARQATGLVERCNALLARFSPYAPS